MGKCVSKQPAIGNLGSLSYIAISERSYDWSLDGVSLSLYVLISLSGQIHYTNSQVSIVIVLIRLAAL